MAFDGEEHWNRTVRRIATFAMGPQAAMVTIMLLVIGIGLWYFPRTSTHDSELIGDTVTQIPEGTDPPTQGDADQALTPVELRHRADGQRRVGDCAEATSQYETLLRRFPTYPSAASVRIDLAECYLQLGQRSEARTVLQQAAQDPAARERAESALRRLEAP